MVAIGRFMEEARLTQETQLWSDSPALLRHLERPWLRAWIQQASGLQLAEPDPRAGQRASLEERALAMHTFCVGGSGAGKSHGMELMLEQLIGAGCSVVAADLKPQLLRRLALRAQQAGLTPEQIVWFSPGSSPHGLPGYNPLLTDLPIEQIAADLVDLLHANSRNSWGPRMQDILTNCLLVMAAHRLSIYEALRFLLREDYRNALLGQPPKRSGSTAAYREAHSFFVEEFALWSRSERGAAVAPISNKLRGLLQIEPLAGLLCSQRNTLDLPRLWQDPHLVLLHLDAVTLGDAGAQLVGGLITQLLYRTALRARSGGRPVILAIDELGLLSRYIGPALIDIAAVARSQGLRLLVACQYLDQLGDDLKTALLSNCAVQIFWRLSHAEARAVAASLAAGAQPRLARLALEAERPHPRTGQLPRTQWRHPLYDPSGQLVRLQAAFWPQLRWQDLFGDKALTFVEQMAAASGIARLYVRAADTGEPTEARHYIRGLKPEEYWLEGPDLALVVSFPRPRLGKSERASESELTQRWTRLLQDLPTQQAVVRVAGTRPGVVKIAHVSPPVVGPAQEAFLTAARLANGQSAEEVAATAAWRQGEVARLTAGRPLREEAQDGSLA